MPVTEKSVKNKLGKHNKGKTSIGPHFGVLLVEIKIIVEPLIRELRNIEIGNFNQIPIFRKKTSR